MNLPKPALSVLSCGLAFAMWAPAQAGDPIMALPGIGEVAPAFALRPFQSGFTAREADEGRSALELDSVCGIRSPASTAAVLVTFIDRDGMNDLVIANGWHRQYAKDGLEIIAISEVERPETFGADVVKARIAFPVLDDRHHVVATRFGIDAAPFSLLLDRQCRVLGLSNNALTAEQSSLKTAISTLVDKAKQEAKRARMNQRR